MARAVAMAATALVVIVLVLFWSGERRQTQRDRTGSLDPDQGGRAGPVLPPGGVASAQRADNGFDCEPYDPYAGLGDAETAAVPERESAEIVSRLESSDDAEHLVVAALLEKDDDPERSFRLLSRAGAVGGDNPLVTWNRLQFCADFGELCAGRLDGIERQAIEVDGGNAALWAGIASIRKRRGDSRRALEALRSAAAAPEYNTYFGEHLLLWDRAIAAAGEQASLHRIAAAHGFAGVSLGAEIHLVSDCSEEAEMSIEWQDYCLRLGEKMEEHGKTYIHRSSGLSLQSTMYEIGADTRQQEIVDARRDSLRERLNRLHDAEVDKFLSRDEALLRAYTDVFISAGELAAIEFADREIERLKSIPGYDSCAH